MSSYLIQFLKLSWNQNGIKQEAKYLFENYNYMKGYDLEAGEL